MVGVDKVHSDGRVPDPGLAVAGLAHFDIFPPKDFGAACLRDANGVRHVSLLMMLFRA
jgi:hypothetical protein